MGVRLEIRVHARSGGKPNDFILTPHLNPPVQGLRHHNGTDGGRHLAFRHDAPYPPPGCCF